MWESPRTRVTSYDNGAIDGPPEMLEELCALPGMMLFSDLQHQYRGHDTGVLPKGRGGQGVEARAES